MVPEVPLPVPVVPEGPAPVAPVLPEVPSPVALPDMPPPAEPLAEPDDPVAPVPPAVLPEVVEPPDMVPLLPALPVEGEAVVLGVVALLVDAPGVVVSAARRSHPISAALMTAVASMAFDSLDSDGMWTP